MHLLLKNTETIVGSSGLHRPDWQVPKFEIGYWIRTSFQGMGYATEAVRAIAEFAFAYLRAVRVEILASARNERSCRVAERANFELEGILRNSDRHVDGSLRDTKVFSRIAT
jgi:RimJ/RimL family protein N-acetyltransferase